jgi:branched-chain amino acid transport system substrate-binding protein
MANDGNQRGTDANETANDLGSDRRTFLKATGLGATGVAAGLAGCTGPSDGDGGDGGGGGDGDGGEIPETIRVGALGPAEAPFGSSILNSAELAAQEINDNGGVGDKGATIEVTTGDTKDDPGTARQRYGEMTSGGDAAHVTTGIFGSEQLLALMGNIADKETVHLSTGAATPEAPAKLQDDYERFKYWFRAGPVNSTFLGDSLVQYAAERFEEMGWEKVAFVAEDFKWTEPVTQTIEDRLADEAGVEITSVRRVAEGTEDFSPIYDQLESEDIDGCYTALAHIGSTSLVQWAKQKRPFGYGGIHVPTQLPSYFNDTEGAAIATFSQTTATPTSEITEKTVPYADAYREEHDKFPVYSGYSTYDAVYMLKKAIEEAGSVNGDDLVTALEEMSHTGTSGQLEFYGADEEFPHDLKYGPELAQGVYFQWQADSEGKGVQEVIWPDELATTEYKSPPWV